MRSAYQFAWYRRGTGIPLEEWWAFVKENKTFDMHVIPYAVTLRNVANEYGRLEEMAQWWEIMKGRYPWAFKHYPDKKVNAAKGDHVEIPPWMAREIEEVFAEDLALWEAASWQKLIKSP
jgi:hypothetical protein